MDVSKFYKLIAGLVLVIALVWLVAYFASSRPGGEPAPDQGTGQYTQEERAKMLDQLRATQPATYTEAERAAMLKSLQATKPATYTEQERKAMLENLRAQ